MEEQDFTYTFEKSEKGLIFDLDVAINLNTHLSISVKNSSIQERQYSFIASAGANLSDEKRFPLIYTMSSRFSPT